jgi:hypothetical protein
VLLKGVEGRGSRTNFFYLYPGAGAAVQAGAVVSSALILRGSQHFSYCSILDLESTSSNLGLESVEKTFN